LPLLINTNDGGRAEPREGLRLRAGQTGYYSGDDADLLLQQDGVVEADSDEGREYIEAHQEPADGGVSVRERTQGILSGLRVAHRTAAIVAPLQRVIGDDEAPMGPPSGVITTKSAAAGMDSQSRQAFAQNEALPEDVALDEERAPQRVAQAKLKAGADELTVELNEAVETPGFTTEPKPGPVARTSDAAPDEPQGDEDDGDDEPKGADLDKALDEAGLQKSGTADEKRARLREHRASQGG
jgi:hypothetical protein